MTETKTFDPKKAIEAQDNLCHEKGLPLFPPYDGKCYRCGDNIYKEKHCSGGKYHWVMGISVEEAGKKHITRCPHCSYSFCD